MWLRSSQDRISLFWSISVSSLFKTVIALFIVATLFPSFDSAVASLIFLFISISSSSVLSRAAERSRSKFDKVDARLLRSKTSWLRCLYVSVEPSNADLILFYPLIIFYKSVSMALKRVEAAGLINLVKSVSFYLSWCLQPGWSLPFQHECTLLFFEHPWLKSQCQLASSRVSGILPSILVHQPFQLSSFCSPPPRAILFCLLVPIVAYPFDYAC